MLLDDGSYSAVEQPLSVSVATSSTESVSEVVPVSEIKEGTTTPVVVAEEEVQPVTPRVTPPAPVVDTAPVTTPAPEVIEDPAPSGITMTDVRAHDDASSCWSVVNGLVYDLTAYIPKHPGGKSEILAICGTDGTSAFEGQHGGESKPERILATYYIGDLE